MQQRDYLHSRQACKHFLDKPSSPDRNSQIDCKTCKDESQRCIPHDPHAVYAAAAVVVVCNSCRFCWWWCCGTENLKNSKPKKTREIK